MSEQELLKLPQGTLVRIRDLEPYQNGTLVFSFQKEFQDEEVYGIAITYEGVKCKCFEFKAEDYELV